MKKTSIGGQALIEGIMMRGPKRTTMAVRRPEGDIVLESRDTDNSVKPWMYRAPFVRGIFNFIDSMKQGYHCLMRSAELAGLEDSTDTKTAEKAPDEITEPNIKTPEAENISNGDTKSEKKDDTIQPWMMNLIMVISTVLGVVLAIVLFKALPEAIYGGLTKLIPALDGSGYGYSLLRALFVGVVKIVILVGYMLAVSLMKDIRRTFMYHGAEHKSIACYESGLELTVENVRLQRRFHPRCGTSFLILMVLVGVFITMFIPAKLVEGTALNVLLRSLISIALLPLMMGIGYELIKLAGKYDNALTRIISAPGMWLQHITTREPDDGMIECAIAALKDVIPGDGSDAWEKK